MDDPARPSRPSTLLAAAAAYALLTVALTWPLVRGLTRDLPADFGDPLLNTWILAWDAEHMLRGLAGHFAALGEYWNANIYYPHPLALAYSEHLTAQALLILPVYAVTKNPILSYNVLFLLTFFLSAAGAFLFVRTLTGSTAGAFVAGLAFGFAPYRFGTMPHVQVLSSMWMPFVLLGFHNFFASRRTAPLAGATLAWIAQNLSCGYYLLYFSPVVALYLAIEIPRLRVWRDSIALSKIAAAVTAVALATLPFLLPYWQLRQSGFNARSLVETRRYSADAFGYLTAEGGMKLWGAVMRAWPQSEGYLFPGVAIVALALVAIVQAGWIPTLRAENTELTGISSLRRPRSSAMARTTPGASKGWSSRWLTSRVANTSAVARVLAVLLAAASAVSVAILFGWSLRVGGGGLDVRLTSLGRGLFVVAALTIALFIASPRARTIGREWFGSAAAALCAITVFAFAMSLGPDIHARGRTVEEWNIYAWFYEHVPGFDGLRVPARNAMIVALGLAALAGQGAAHLARRYGRLFVVVAGMLIVIESFAAPVPVNVNSTEFKQAGLAPLPGRLTTPADIPAVYRFVATLPPSTALLELPFGEVAYETRYMFFSTAHWRSLVNGYSGGGPDEYGLWAERLKDLHTAPDQAWQAVADTHATHLIVHEGSYTGERGREVSDWAIAHGAREVGAFGSDRVFAVR